MTYVDIDPVAVSVSPEIPKQREGHGDPGRRPRSAGGPRPPAGAQASGLRSALLAAVPSGSYLVISHAVQPDENVDLIKDVYQRQTTTQRRLRSRSGITGFFESLQLVESGVFGPQRRPEPEDPTDFNDDPALSIGLCGVARKP